MNEQPAPPRPRPHPFRGVVREQQRTALLSGRLYIVVFVCVLLGVLWLYWGRERYYDWLFRNAERMELVVYCDTRPLQGKPVEAFLFYDSVALSPVAHFLGLYQDRPPDRVGSATMRAADIETLDADAVWFRDIPRGPIHRVAFRTADGAFHVDAYERKVYNGRITIRASGP
ncbi:MAG: hypothetical protein HQ559_09275 [Lentisphaerae bacterium]|nr:hypothetical protein [Lentisphaerota bacterium]